MISAHPPCLHVVSGAGAKGPACFVVDTGGPRLMLDLGYGPQPGLWPDVRTVGPVDALLLSHGHADHAGGLKLRSTIGDPPLWASEAVLRGGLPSGLPCHTLPLQGASEVLGITVRCGRSGHAPGGIWIHLAVGDGLLYMGDNSVESALYAFDPPPPAATVIVDASYGDYDETLEACQRRLAPAVVRGPLLLPVPETGRGPEIALHLYRAGITPCLSGAMREALQRLSTVDHAVLRPGVAQTLAEIASRAPAIDAAQGVMLAGRADGAGGDSAALIERWQAAAEPAMVFTGYLPPGTPAATLTAAGRAQYLRWNVHPRLSDNAALVKAADARTVIAAFGDARHREAWQRAFAPARLLLQGPVLL